ncbi:integrase [Salinibacter ruber]|uniref:tyrosine-type recombinase/integrase n=1 Tax=Salinibacter ruber TaxID=146919 RepID=UPI00216A85FA|nr:site-specific integrase [Salinibacter ruber]MCS3664484.1 integrase [Salinibacter ruber]
MASLVQQHGRYFSQFYDADRTPQRKRIALQTSSPEVAKRLHVRAEDKYALGEYDPWRDGREHELFGWEAPPKKDLSTLGKARDAFLESKSHLRPATQRTYREVLRLFVRHVGEETRTSSITPSEIADWIDSKPEISDATRRKYVSHVGYLVRYLVEKGWLDRDISKDVGVPKKTETPTKAITSDQVGKIVQAIEDDGDEERYRYLILILRVNPMIGLRTGELLEMRWEEGPVRVDLDKAVVHVASGGDFKTKSGQARRIPLSEKAARLLTLEKQDSASDYVFQRNGCKVKYTTLASAFRRFRKDAGVASWVTLHSTRHAFGTRLASAGTPIHVIKKLMGHSTTSVTEQYLHAAPEQGHHYVNKAFGD